MPSEEFPEYKETPGACPACGNASISHRGAYLVATVSIVISSVSRWCAWWRWWKYFVRVVAHSGAMLDRYAYGLLHLAGVVQYAHDPSRARTYRSQVVWEEALRRGIEMEQIVMLGRYTDTYRARIGGWWRYFESLPVPPSYAAAAYAWIDDKFVLKQLLQRRGLSVPRSFRATSRSQARAAFGKIGGTVVVKPRSGTRGRHTTTRVSTLAQLNLAFDTARQLCHFVSIEEHLVGSVCRGTVVGGVLVGFLQALPPRIIGDGVSTVSELVALRNEHRPERVKDIVLDAEHVAYLARQGLNERSVPRQGEIVDLSHRTGRLFGGITREILDTVHQKLRTHLEHAAAILDVPVVGFDLIIEDPEADPDRQRWGIIEANSLPFIDLHYLPLHGTPSNVAAAVWDLWNA